MDEVKNADVAVIERAVFRALTRWRAATINGFDTIARLGTPAIDACSDAHAPWQKPVGTCSLWLLRHRSVYGKGALTSITILQLSFYLSHESGDVSIQIAHHTNLLLLCHVHINFVITFFGQLWCECLPFSSLSSPFLALKRLTLVTPLCLNMSLWVYNNFVMVFLIT